MSTFPNVRNICSNSYTGQDGAEGLSILRSRGWHTIAQDRDNYAVYGISTAALNAEIEIFITRSDRQYSNLGVEVQAFNKLLIPIGILWESAKWALLKISTPVQPQFQSC